MQHVKQIGVGRLAAQVSQEPAQMPTAGVARAQPHPRPSGEARARESLSAQGSLQRNGLGAKQAGAQRGPTRTDGLDLHESTSFGLDRTRQGELAWGHFAHA